MFFTPTKFDITLCKQTMTTLIRHRILRRLIWVCTVCPIFPNVFKIGVVQQLNMHSKQPNTLQRDSPLQYRENVHYLLQPHILRLYTGCRLDQTLSKCIASFKK